jgi:hypothetical protein
MRLKVTYWFATYPIREASPIHACACLGERKGRDEDAREEGRLRLRGSIVGNELDGIREDRGERNGLGNSYERCHTCQRQFTRRGCATTTDQGGRAGRQGIRLGSEGLFLLW